MKLIAYRWDGPHLAWSNVDFWKVDGPILYMQRYGVPESFKLPAEIIGLSDDAAPAAPAPSKYDQAKEKKSWHKSS